MRNEDIRKNKELREKIRESKMVWAREEINESVRCAVERRESETEGREDDRGHGGWILCAMMVEMRCLRAIRGVTRMRNEDIRKNKEGIEGRGTEREDTRK